MTYIRFCAALTLCASLAFGQNIDATRLRYTAPGGTQRVVANKFQDYVSVKDFGAAGDGATDDTVAINLALTASHNVFIPDGTYSIACDSTTDNQESSGGLAPQSNSTVTLGQNVLMKCKANSTGFYNLFRLKDVSNVTIRGGVLDGNKSSSIAPSGTQYGYGIGMQGVSDILIDNVTAQNFWGDGFYADQSQGTLTHNQRIQIRSSRVIANRRNGMSIIDCTDCKIIGSTFSNSGGTAPEAGIDVEPGAGGTRFVTKLEVIGNTFSGNTEWGIILNGANGTTPTYVDHVLLAGNISTGNSGQGAIELYGVSYAVVEHNSVNQNTQIGIRAQYDSDIRIDNNLIDSNGSATDNTYDQIFIANSTRPSVSGNVIRAGSNANLPRYGLNSSANTDAVLENNDLENSGKTGDLHDSSSTNTTAYLNRLTTGTPALLFPPPSSTTTSPTIIPSGSQPNAKTYVYALSPADTDGSMSIGIDNPANTAFAEIRGGLITSGNPGSSVSGVRLMRGTATGGWEVLGQFSDTIALNFPVQAPSYKATSTGITFPDNTVQTTAATPQYLSKSVSYTIQTTDGRLLNLTANATAGAITETLYACSSSATGNQVSIKKIDSSSNGVNIAPNGSDVIDNNASLQLVRQYDALTMSCDGANHWWIF